MRPFATALTTPECFITCHKPLSALTTACTPPPLAAQTSSLAALPAEVAALRAELAEVRAARAAAAAARDEAATLAAQLAASEDAHVTAHEVRRLWVV